MWSNNQLRYAFQVSERQLTLLPSLNVLAAMSTLSASLIIDSTRARVTETFTAFACNAYQYHIP